MLADCFISSAWKAKGASINPQILLKNRKGKLKTGYYKLDSAYAYKSSFVSGLPGSTAQIIYTYKNEKDDNSTIKFYSYKGLASAGPVTNIFTITPKNWSASETPGIQHCVPSNKSNCIGIYLNTVPQ